MVSITDKSKSQVRQWPQSTVWKALPFHPHFPLQRGAFLATEDNDYFEHDVHVRSNQLRHSPVLPKHPTTEQTDSPFPRKQHALRKDIQLVSICSVIELRAGKGNQVNFYPESNKE